MANTPSFPKESFLELLTTRTPTEINELILERGKPVKPVPLIIFDKKPTKQ